MPLLTVAGISRKKEFFKGANEDFILFGFEKKHVNLTQRYPAGVNFDEMCRPEVLKMASFIII